MSELKTVILECAGCTAPLSEAIVAKGVHKCPYCGYVNILPKEEQSSEVLHYLRTADSELKNYEFERAYNAYSKAAELDSEESKAYFGMALCANRVKYIKDVVNNRWQAICCEITDKKFALDANFVRALECATPDQKEEYLSRAKEIDYIRERFAELEKSGLSYDTFICVKVSDGEGGFTVDSHWAGKLYDNIKRAGLKPFYSEREIGNRTGEDYEALILYALYSSKSMIIICSNEDYLRTPWVQNEYTRYYSMMSENDKQKNSIMIAFSKNVVERIPGIPGKIQGVDLGSFDASQKINEFVSKFANAEERARREAEEKAKREAEQRAKEEAAEKARLEQQKELEELRKQLQTLAKQSTSRAQSDTADKEDDFEETETPEQRAKREQKEKEIAEYRAMREAKRKAEKEAEQAAAQAIIDAEERAKREAEEKIKRRKEFASLKAEYAKKGYRFLGNHLERYDGDETNVVIPDGITKILDNAFSNNSSVQSIVIPDTVTSIGDSAFYYCKSLESIEIPYSVTSIGYDVFHGCESLISMTIPDSVTSIGRSAFNGCTALEYVKFGKGIASVGAHSFFECTALESVELPSTISSIGDFAFYGCKSLEKVNIPSGVTSIGESAFSGCTTLTEINADQSNTKYKSIDGILYSKDGTILVKYPIGKDLRELEIPAEVMAISPAAFAGCTAIRKIKLHQNVSVIGNSAFEGCTNLVIDSYVKKPLFGLPSGFHKLWLGRPIKYPMVNWIKQ